MLVCLRLDDFLYIKIEKKTGSSKPIRQILFYIFVSMESYVKLNYGGLLWKEIIAE